MSGEHDDPPHAALPPGLLGAPTDGFGALGPFEGTLSSRPASTVPAKPGAGGGSGAVPWITGVAAADGCDSGVWAAGGGASDLIAPPLHAGSVVIAPSVSAARRAS